MNHQCKEKGLSLLLVVTKEANGETSNYDENYVVQEHPSTQCHMIRWFYPRITIRFTRPEWGSFASSIANGHESISALLNEKSGQQKEKSSKAMRKRYY